MIGAVLGLGLVAATLACVAYLAMRKRHRQVWARLESGEASVRRLEHKLLLLDRQLTLSSVSGLRLEPRLPAQNGEDLLIWRYFEGRREGTFLEAGAYDGVENSNTYFLEAVGWSGVLVEPNPSRFEECARNRPFSRCVHAALVAPGCPSSITLRLPHGGASGLDALAYTEETARHRARLNSAGANLKDVVVPARTLDEVIGSNIDRVEVLSLDLEGAELRALQGFDFDRWKPALILVEDNSGGVDRSCTEYLTQRGFPLRGRVGANLVFSAHDDRRRLDL